jgi:hypothetical protein
MRFKGSISIESNHDSLLVSVSKNKIVGIMIDGTSLPPELFTYEGELRLLSCKTTEGTTLERQSIKLQGVDYWELDNEKWEDDGLLWGTKGGTYLTGTKPKKSAIKNDKFAKEKAQPFTKNESLSKVINAVRTASKGSY